MVRVVSITSIKDTSKCTSSAVLLDRASLVFFNVFTILWRFVSFLCVSVVLCTVIERAKKRLKSLPFHAS